MCVGERMYLCKLIDNGFVKECFYREGDSREDVLSGLELFDWRASNKAYWIIRNTEEKDEYSEEIV